MKVALYAICKNESRNVRMFLECAKHADYIRVVDTGSEDDTIDLFVEQATLLGLEDKFEIVQAIFEPFRFNVARNYAMHYAKTTCDAEAFMFLDMDERFHEQDWRVLLDTSLEKFKQSPQYSPDFALYATMNLCDINGNVVTSYNQLKGHSRDNFEWRYSVHEVLSSTVSVTSVTTGLNLLHHKDESKERKYLHLLKEDFDADPLDHRCVFYYGRELFYAGQYSESLDVLATATNADHGYFDAQQVEVYRTMYYCSKDIRYLHAALSLNPNFKDIYFDLALFYRDNKNYFAAIGQLYVLFSVEENNLILFKDPCIDLWKAHDLMSECMWYAGYKAESLKYAHHAYSKNPAEPRLKQNLEFFLEELRKQEDPQHATNS